LYQKTSDIGRVADAFYWNFLSQVVRMLLTWNDKIKNEDIRRMLRNEETK